MNEEKGLIIIPAYNEENHISQIVHSSIHYLPVIVVDDGSIDQTSLLAEKNGATVFKQVPNLGKGEALKRGFREALKLEADFVVTLDADGQHAIDEIEKFLSLYREKKPDLIIGYRDFSKMPFSRKLANTIGRQAFSWAMGMRILDNQSGYRLMSRRLIEKVLESQESGFEFEVDVIVNCVQSNFMIDWLPIKTIYRDEKSHIHPLAHTINFFRIVFQTRKKMKKYRN